LAVTDNDLLCGIITKNDIAVKYYRRFNQEHFVSPNFSSNNQITIKKSYVFILCIIVISLLFVLFKPLSNLPNIFEKPCKDYSFSGMCAFNKSYFCSNGTLIYSPSTCGCPEEMILVGGSCIDRYKINPEYREIKFILRSQIYLQPILVYRGLNDYLSTQQSWTYTVSRYEDPSEEEVLRVYAERWINQPNQERLIDPVVETIQNITSNKDDQARIAISLVQNIPYDFQGYQSNSNNNKYPYQVLYSGTGVCGEKSKLLALLLKKLGFGVALLDYPAQNHEAVGIKCPVQYSIANSGYCFVESTDVTIVTYSAGVYLGAGKLSSSPIVIPISDGYSFDSVAEEYYDAQKWVELEEYAEANSRVFDPQRYSEWSHLVQKYGINFV
jgi:hypothetical protein